MKFTARCKIRVPMVALDPRPSETKVDYFVRAIELAQRTRTDVCITWENRTLIVTQRATAKMILAEFEAPLAKPKARKR